MFEYFCKVMQSCTRHF